MNNEKTILFTGTNPKRFAVRGRMVHQPMVALEALDDYRELHAVLSDIDSYDWILFTSRYAVTFFCEQAKDVDFPKHLKVCAIGKATAAHLDSYGVAVDCVPDDESAEGIIALLVMKHIEGNRILLPRSNLGRNRLPDALREAGAEVRVVTTYRNVCPSYETPVPLDGIDEIFFTSPSTVRNFLAYYSEVPAGVAIRCIGDVTCEEARKHGLPGEVVHV